MKEEGRSVRASKGLERALVRGSSSPLRLATILIFEPTEPRT